MGFLCSVSDFQKFSSFLLLIYRIFSQFFLDGRIQDSSFDNKKPQRSQIQIHQIQTNLSDIKRSWRDQAEPKKYHITITSPDLDRLAILVTTTQENIRQRIRTNPAVAKKIDQLSDSIINSQDRLSQIIAGIVNSRQPLFLTHELPEPTKEKSSLEKEDDLFQKPLKFEPIISLAALGAWTAAGTGAAGTAATGITVLAGPAAATTLAVGTTIAAGTTVTMSSIAVGTGLTIGFTGVLTVTVVAPVSTALGAGVTALLTSAAIGSTVTAGVLIEKKLEAIAAADLAEKVIIAKEAAEKIAQLKIAAEQELQARLMRDAIREAIIDKAKEKALEEIKEKIKESIQAKAAPHKCELIHVLATMLAAYPDDHKNPIAIPIGIDCVDKTEEKNQEPDPKLEHVLFMQPPTFIYAQFVQQWIGSYITIGTQFNDPCLATEKLLNGYRENAQRAIELAKEQRIGNENARQMRNEIWQDTRNFIQQMGLPQDIVQQASKMYCSRGAYRGMNGRLITLITNSGSQRQFVKPDNHNTMPFELYSIIPIENQRDVAFITNPAFDPVVTPAQKHFDSLEPIKQLSIAQLFLFIDFVPFTPVYHEDGRIKTDKQGNAIDVNNDVWEWDKDKKVYHVHKLGTKTGFQIDPKKYQELEKQKEKDKKVKQEAADDKTKKSGGPNDPKDPKKPDNKYTHKHGTAHESDKHHPNSPDNIGKPARDAQAALDNSFEVNSELQYKMAKL